MASLPDPCYVLLLNDTWFRVDHAATTNDVVVPYKDGSTYRNELSTGYIGAPNVQPGLVLYNDDFKSSDDVFNHTSPHDNLLNRTERQFVGATRAVSGSTTTGSAVIVVPDSSLISVGMAITGVAGITAGSLVSSITDATHIVITQIATATGATVLTIGGTDILARCWVDEFKEYSANPPQLTGQAVKLWPST